LTPAPGFSIGYLIRESKTPCPKAHHLRRQIDAETNTNKSKQITACKTQPVRDKEVCKNSFLGQAKSVSKTSSFFDLREEYKS
jgi:hypothetical protein